MKKSFVENKKQTPSQSDESAQTQDDIKKHLKSISEAWKKCPRGWRNPHPFAPRSPEEGDLIVKLELFFDFCKKDEIGLGNFFKHLKEILKKEDEKRQKFFKELFSRYLFSGLCMPVLQIVNEGKEGKEGKQEDFEALLHLTASFFFKNFFRYTETNYKKLVGYHLWSYILVHGSLDMLRTLSRHHPYFSENGFGYTVVQEKYARKVGNSTEPEKVRNPIALMIATGMPEDEIIERFGLLFHNELSAKQKFEIFNQLIIGDCSSLQLQQFNLPSFFLERLKDSQDQSKIGRLLIENSDCQALTKSMLVSSKVNEAEVCVRACAIDIILRFDRVDLVRCIQDQVLRKLVKEEVYFLNEATQKHRNMTVFQYAIAYGSRQCIRYLLQKAGAAVDVNALAPLSEGDSTEVTALIIAIFSGDLDLVQLLLKKKANPNIQGKDFRGKNSYGPTALTMALHRVVADTTDLRKEKRDKGNDLRIQELQKQQRQSLSIVEMLLVRGKADPNQSVGLTKGQLEHSECPTKPETASENWKLSPMYIAVTTQAYEVMGLLIQSNATLDPDTNPYQLSPMNAALDTTTDQNLGQALEILVCAWKGDIYAPRRYTDGWMLISLAEHAFFGKSSLLRYLCQYKNFDLDHPVKPGSKRTFRSYLKEDTNTESEFISGEQIGVDGVVKDKITVTISSNFQQILRNCWNQIFEKHGLLESKQVKGSRVMAHDDSVLPIAEHPVFPIAESVPQAIVESEVISEAAAEALNAQAQQAQAADLREQQDQKIREQQDLIRQKVINDNQDLECQKQGYRLHKGAKISRFRKKPTEQKKNKKAIAELTSPVQASPVVTPKKQIAHRDQVPTQQSMNKPAVSSRAALVSRPEENLGFSSLGGLPSFYPSYGLRLPSKQAEKSSEHPKGSQPRHQKQEKFQPAQKSIETVSSNAMLGGGGVTLNLDTAASQASGGSQLTPQLIQKYQTALRNLSDITDILQSSQREEMLKEKQNSDKETILMLATLQHILALANSMIDWQSDPVYRSLGERDRKRVYERILEIQEFRNLLAHSIALPKAELVWNAVQQFVAACGDQDRNADETVLIERFQTKICNPLQIWYEAQQEQMNLDVKGYCSSQKQTFLDAYRVLVDETSGLLRDRDDNRLKNSTLPVEPVVIPAAFSLQLHIQELSKFLGEKHVRSPNNIPQTVRRLVRNELAHNVPGDLREGRVSPQGWLRCAMNCIAEIARGLGSSTGSSIPSSSTSSQEWLLTPPVASVSFAAVVSEPITRDSVPEPGARKQASASVLIPSIGAECIGFSGTSLFAPVSQETSETEATIENQKHEEIRRLQF